MQVSPIVPVSPPTARSQPDKSTADNLRPEETAATAPGAHPSAAVLLAVKSFEPAPPLRPTVQDQIDMNRVLLRLRV